MFTNKQPFEKYFWITIAALGVAGLGLLILTFFQGPRVRKATIDIQKATLQSDQRLLLVANQPLGKITSSQVHISPSVSVQAVASGSNVLLQFTQRLQYETTYHITIDIAGGRKLSYEFTTSQPSVYYLREHKDGKDEIRRSTLDGKKDERIYEAANIVDYALLEDALLINTGNADYTNTLHIYNLTTKTEHRPSLPGKGTIGDLQSAPNRQSWGYVFIPRAPGLAPALYVARSSTEKPTLVKGVGGADVPVVNWRFGPDSTLAQVQVKDGSVFVLSTDNTSEPTPLGQFLDIRGFSGDGKRLFLQDRNGPLQINVRDLTKNVIPYTPPGGTSFLTDIQPLANSNNFLLRGQAYLDNQYKEFIIYMHDTRQRTIFSVSLGRTILSMAPSPNDQYLAISTSELHNGEPRQTADIITTSEGSMRLQLQGRNVRW